MSANNQTLIKEYKGKWYVFTDIQAESWCEVDGKDKIIEGRENELHLNQAKTVCDSRDEAYEKALEIDSKQGQWEEGTEYGVQFNRLCKDDGELKIIE